MFRFTVWVDFTPLWLNCRFIQCKRSFSVSEMKKKINKRKMSDGKNNSGFIAMF